MPASINMPSVGSRQEKDPLDTISKALNIASQIYGFGLAKDEATRKAQEHQAATEERSRLTKGDYLPGEAARLNTEGIRFIPAATPNSRGGGLSIPEGAVKVNLVDPETGMKTPGYFERPKAERPEKVYDPYEREIKRLDIEEKRRKLSEPKISKSDERLVNSLAEKTASKVSIKNQIDAAYGQLADPQIPEDQKVTLGENLLKTLNSTEGADAVGAEEAKRLASFLKFKIGNFTGPGKFIGRDLDKFVEQVRLTSDRIGTAIDTNQAQIEKIASGGKITFGKKEGSEVAGAKKQGPINAGLVGKEQELANEEDRAAVEWAKKNPKDPRAQTILKFHGVK